ncbi:MAG: hypothetical protein HON76_09565 [Candidatus Scalindua sp.]|jgi:hypothetical protein|nr:hypothetical protein [Candidatus Scalindua sp.]
MSRFQDVMQHLHPKVIIEKVDLPHDTARAKYALPSSIARSHSEFEKIIINYTDHHMKEVFNGNTLPPDLLLAKAQHYLEFSANLKQSIFTGLSGTDGGMHTVLNNIAEAFKMEAKKAYFVYVIDTFIDPLSFTEVVEVMRDLKGRLGGYSPQPFAFIQAESMAGDYQDILWQYISSLGQYKNLWQY